MKCSHISELLLLVRFNLPQTGHAADIE